MKPIFSLFEKRSLQAQHMVAWIVCLSGGLLFFYEFIQMNIINSLSVQLMSALNLNAEGLGRLSSIYFYANISLLFVAGNLLDRFSTRRIIIVAMSCCTLGTFGFGFAHSFLFAGLCRALIGFGGSFCFLSGVRLASRWFPPRRMALITGVIVTMAFIGGWVAQTPVTLLDQWIGWRATMLVDGIFGTLLTIWIFCVVQDRPIHHLEKTTEDYQKLKAQGLWKGVKMILTNRQNWLGGIYTCLLNLPIMLLGAMWGRMYFMQVSHFSAADASSICGMLFLGSILGSPFVGYVSDKIRLRRLPMQVGATLSLILVLAIIYLPSLDFVSLSVMFFLLGFITCSQVISYPLAAEHNPSMLTGSAVSIVSMTCLLGGAIGMPFSGWLLDQGWDHTLLNGAPQYSAAAFHHAMLIMPIAFSIALIVTFFIKETHCQSQHPETH